MTRNQALRLAVMALGNQMQRLAYDSNVETKIPGTGNDYTKRVNAEYVQLAEAVKVLEAMMRQKELF